jgi:hypothetical protein
MTHNTPEEKSPATTADITKSSWLEDPLPAAVHFRHGWSLTVAFLLAIGVFTGQIMMLDILPSRLLWDQGRMLGNLVLGFAGLGASVTGLLLWYGWLKICKLLAVIVLISTGMGVLIHHRSHLPELVMLPDHPVMVNLIITESQRYRTNRQQIKARIAPEDPLYAVTSTHLVRLIVPDDIDTLYPGYHITAEVSFQPLLPQLLPGGFDFTEHALRQNIVAGGFVRSVHGIDDLGTYRFARMRRGFQENLYAVMDTEWAAPIASALLPGLRASIPAELREAWRGAG